MITHWVYLPRGVIVDVARQLHVQTIPSLFPYSCTACGSTAAVVYTHKYLCNVDPIMAFIDSWTGVLL